MKKMDAESIKARLENGQNVQAEMTWSLPAPDDRVEWSLWTSAMDTSAAVRFASLLLMLLVLCVLFSCDFDGSVLKPQFVRLLWVYLICAVRCEAR